MGRRRVRADGGRIGSVEFPETAHCQSGSFGSVRVPMRANWRAPRLSPEDSHAMEGGSALMRQRETVALQELDAGSGPKTAQFDSHGMQRAAHVWDAKPRSGVRPSRG